MKYLNMNLAVALCLVFGLWSCVDIDIFGNNLKPIVKGYYLEYDPDGDSFRISKGLNDDSPTGVVEGRTTKIGWDAESILVWIEATFEDDPSNWMAINLRSGAVSGPYSDDDIARDPRLSLIDTSDARKVFDSLNRK